MKYISIVVALAIVLCTGFSKTIDVNKERQAFIAKVMKKMTLEDKVGEMTQLSIDVLSQGQPYALVEPHTFDTEKLKHVLVDLKVGSILNAGGHAYSQDHWQTIMDTIQHYAMDIKKSGIPVLYGIDAIHGVNYTSGTTLFPQQLGQASTWNIDLAKECGKVTAYETRASGIPWTFSPVLDLGRDPRWPRLWETYGEDVHLACSMAENYIDGLQGDDLASPYQVTSCMKHFLGYSMPWSGKDRTPAYIPERQLRTYFLPTFQTAIANNSRTIMINSGEMNGIPVHADSRILKDLLRTELGFTGVAVTDWEDVGYLVSRHRIAKDFKEAIAIAINAGIDMAMVPLDTSFPVLLKELVEEGKVPMERINESVQRILELKYDLGLFEKADWYKEVAYPLVGSSDHQKMALAAAEESYILAKNEGAILPLSMETKIYIAGPNRDALNIMNGGWTGTWQGADSKYDNPAKLSVEKALKQTWGGSVVNSAAEADVIITVVGETPYTEKPGDITDLALDAAQTDLVKELASEDKPIVLVVLEGRPRIISSIEPLCSAIVVGFLPGNEGGIALANILSGKVNPSGKMPITYPRYANDLVAYDHKWTEAFDKDFGWNAYNPQYPFGHGLSYSTFEYSDLNVVKNGANGLKVSVSVSNTSAIAGKEVVQLYVSDKVASITPSVKLLKGFSKHSLAPGESKVVEFILSQNDLSFIGRDLSPTFEAGEFEIKIADLVETVELGM